MGAELEYDAAARLIRVREYGVLDGDEFVRSIQRIREIHERDGCTRVLVDAREQVNRTDGGDAFDRAATAARTLAGTGVRIAVVVATPLLKGHGFFETVSVNRGLSVRVFTEEASALTWLGG